MTRECEIVGERKEPRRSAGEKKSARKMRSDSHDSDHSSHTHGMRIMVKPKVMVFRKLKARD